MPLVKIIEICMRKPHVGGPIKTVGGFWGAHPPVATQSVALSFIPQGAEQTAPSFSTTRNNRSIETQSRQHVRLIKTRLPDNWLIKVLTDFKPFGLGFEHEFVKDIRITC